MNEFDLIKLLTRSLPSNATVVTGPGDDCAVLDLGLPDKWLLLKTDAVVEGVHFRSDAPMNKVGHKALGRCLSDVAAMAGTPVAAMVTLGLPKQFSPSAVEEIYAGINALASRYEVAVVGGETTTNPERILLSISLLGTVLRGKAVLRSGARIGDAIFVTGDLGGSMSGKHFDFEPRLTEGRWLAQHFPINSMMDISDGLAGDLRHILNASKVGAELAGSAIPISRQARLIAKTESAKPALLAALSDGEDFELLFTLPSRHAVPVLDGWKTQFPKLRLSCIGKIIEGHGITIRDKNGLRPLAVHGYTHFA